MDNYEVPELRRNPKNINPIDTLNFNINNYNNINNNLVTKSLDFNKISTIQENLLKRLKDEFKISMLGKLPGTNLTVTYKKVPVIKSENPEPFVYAKNYN